MAVRPACACTRYLSPTRWSKPTKRTLQIGSSRLCSSLPNSPSPRGRSKTHTAGRWRNFSNQSSQDNHNVADIHTQQSRYTSIPGDKLPPGGNPKNATSLENLTEGLKNWTPWAKFKAPDITTFAKLVANLNIEVPKYIPTYHNLLPKAVRLKDAKEEESTETAEKVEDSIKKEDNTKCDQELLERLKHRREKLLTQSEVAKSLREQHDFEEAMTYTQESIKNYYSKINLKVSETDDKNIPVETKASGESSKAEESTSTIMKQISNLRQVIPGVKTEPGQDPKAPIKVEDKKLVQRQVVAKGSIDRRTRGLVIGLKKATSNMSQLMRLEDFCRHIAEYPDAKALAIKEKVVSTLLKLRKSKDPAVCEQALAALSLVGYVDPVKGRGIRILAIDGGGTRGLMAIEMLRKLQEETNKEMHELFDFMCGVSTGSLLVTMLGAFRVPLDEIEEVYKMFSTQMFSRSKIMGTSRLFLDHAFYDTEMWENILKEHIGLKSYLDTTKDAKCPKLAAVSALTNTHTVENYVFRNYTFPMRAHSHYKGSADYHLWEGIRASSAAPGYYEEFKLGNYIHQDGGLLTNNPTSIAIHECKQLWPNNSLQCVVSIGTGRYKSLEQLDPSYTNLKNKIIKMVQSATDTESVHTTLHDMLPPSAYFRFNPYMSEDYMLDETRPEKWDQFKQDTQMYCRKNEYKIKMAANRLNLTKMPHQKLYDWANEKKNMIG